MGIKNFSTTIAAKKTVDQIRDKLIKLGAKSVEIEYDKGEPTAISFRMATKLGVQSFQLPANPEGVYGVLLDDYKHRLIDRKYANYEQAVRTSWRTLQDFIEAQVAIIQAGLTTVDQILFPFMLTQSGQTVYHDAVSRYKALPEGED